VWPGTAAGGGGSSWVDPDRIGQGTPQFGAASVGGDGHGYVVVQGMRFGATGAPQAFTVPPNAAYVSYSLAGAQGGDYGLGNPGGRGATVEGSFIAQADDTIQINVGGGGLTTACASSPTCAVNSFGGPEIFDVADDTYRPGTFAYQFGANGGGLSVPESYFTINGWNGFSYPQTGGGGGSDLRICPPGTALEAARSDTCGPPLASAAGGGGASIYDFWEGNVSGGAGGCTVGGTPSNDTDGGPGGGGTQTEGGAGGSPGPSGSTSGSPGAALTGGAGGSGDNSISQSRFGAGGGAGYFGGGGGGGGGSVEDAFLHTPGAGGGGSSLVPTGAACVVGNGPRTNQTYSAADGYAVISMPVLAPGRPPGAVAVSIDDTTAEVVWSPPATFNDATVALVSYSDDSGTTWSTPQTFPATPPVYVTGLTVATPYMFRVALQNAYGIGPQSPNSNIIRTTATAPAQVTGVDDTAYPNAIWVTWSAPADNGEPIRGYDVRWSTDGGATWDDSANTESPVTSMMIGELTSADSYVFQVAATNAIGTGSWSVTSSPALTPIGIPTAPGTPSATAEFERIEWDWTAASIPGSPGNGQAITGYEVEVIDDSTRESFIVDTESTDDSFTLTGVFSGRSYSARVRAMNDEVPGAWSNTSQPVAADGLADAPTDVLATPAVASARLAWEDPGSLSGGTLLGFRIEAIEPGSRPWRQIATADPLATTAEVPDLTPGTSYRFRLAAVTRVPLGGGASVDVRGAWSAITPTIVPSASPPPAPSPPSPPQSVTAVAGDRAVDVAWAPPADPGSFAITDYQAIATPGGRSCVAVAPAARCRIANLTNGVGYSIAVRALNGAGWGAFSDPTPAVVPVPPTPATIVITGSRETVRGRPGIAVSGTATGLDLGARLTPWVRLRGQLDFTPGIARIPVDSSGAFTWQRRTAKKVTVYVTTSDAAVRSNRVTIPRVLGDR
jgi:hypothetical protein